MESQNSLKNNLKLVYKIGEKVEYNKKIKHFEAENIHNLAWILVGTKLGFLPANPCQIVYLQTGGRCEC